MQIARIFDRCQRFGHDDTAAPQRFGQPVADLRGEALDVRVGHTPMPPTASSWTMIANAVSGRCREVLRMNARASLLV